MIRIGRLTSSDRASAGVYEDLSGPEIEKALAAFFAGEKIEWRRVLQPDDRPALEAALRDLVDRERCRLVVTTGGTGPNRRDVTPEATRAVLELELPGFGEIMRTRTFDVAFTVEPTRIVIRATVDITARTGVEMEALTAVSVAALTLYDMCKAVDKSMRIESIHVVEKTKQ